MEVTKWLRPLVYSPGEMRLLVDTPDLPTLQRHATDLGIERGLKARITRMQRSKAWGELGDLKRELIHKEGASGKWDAALVNAASGPRRKKAGARRTNA